MIRKRSLKNRVRGWLPQEPKLSNATIAVQSPIISEKEKAYKRRVASIFLGVAGVLFGWGAAGYAYFCFSRIGVASYDATVYSVIVSLSIITIFWLVASNLKKKYSTFLPRRAKKMNWEKKKKNIKGWLPREPASFPSTQQVEPINGKISAVSTRTMGGLALGSLLSGFALLAAPYLLFPGSYTPKANSSLGYSEPVTIEAWIVLGTAIGLIFLSVLAFTLFGVKLKSQGSKWMKYTYWVTPRQEGSYLEKQLLTITVAANLLIVGVFTGFVVYSAVTARSIEALFSVMLVFSIVIAIVNLVLHEFAKKKPANNQEANA